MYSLMENGAPINRSNGPKDWLAKIELSKLEWPANSPELNPIENAWSICKAHVQAGPRPTSHNAMFAMIQDAWAKFEQEIFARSIGTIPARIETVIKAHGGSTRW